MGCRLCKIYRNFELNILKIYIYIRGYLYISADIYIYHMVIAQCTYCRIGPKSMIYRISTSNEV